MSIWGSLIGGMIGLSLGGPFGMLLGSILGGKINNVFLKSEDMKLSFRGSLINVRKIGSTPVKYPRKSRNLKKNPLGHK